jgi:hypothetical protein
VLDSVPVEQIVSAQFGSFRKQLSLERGERWFVARVHSNRENSAQFNLERLGFRTFTPRIGCKVQHARKLRQILAPRRCFPAMFFSSLISRETDGVP